MARVIDKQVMLNLIIDAKRTDPETGSFAEWLAEYLVQHLPTLTPPNEWVSVVERLPEEEIAPGRRQVTVLVCSKAGRVSSASRVWWPDRGWRWSKMMNNYVTHWMPEAISALEQLAAYEDTGLTPEEIKSLRAAWAVNLKVLESYRTKEAAAHDPK